MAFEEKASAGILLATAAYMLAIVVSWPINTYQLAASCDWSGGDESDYVCEAGHAIGTFIPVAAPLTVWVDGDK